MTKVDDIAYLPDLARDILPNCRVWCLLKLKAPEAETNCPWVVAQWDPVYQKGSWIFCNSTRTSIRLDSNIYKEVEYFTILGM